MFTGLIQAIGKVSRRNQGLLVEGCDPFSPLNLGDSIAVDGVCLTVKALVAGGFLADVSEETFSRTTLGWKAERRGFVNLEPALRFSDRLGGHIVSGHVDGLGEVIAIDFLTKSWRVEIGLKDLSLARYMCEKGSISLDGISLTIAGITGNGSSFWIAVIPHTWDNTSLKYLSTGAFVNLETDLIAKYAENLLNKNLSFGKSGQKIEVSNNLSKEWLLDQGWT